MHTRQGWLTKTSCPSIPEHDEQASEKDRTQSHFLRRQVQRKGYGQGTPCSDSGNAPNRVFPQGNWPPNRKGQAASRLAFSTGKHYNDGSKHDSVSVERGLSGERLTWFIDECLSALTHIYPGLSLSKSPSGQIEPLKP
jgi:hypothetical protein